MWPNNILITYLSKVFDYIDRELLSVPIYNCMVSVLIFSPRSSSISVAWFSLKSRYIYILNYVDELLKLMANKLN